MVTQGHRLRVSSERLVPTLTSCPLGRERMGTGLSLGFPQPVPHSSSELPRTWEVARPVFSRRGRGGLGAQQ